MYEQSHAYSVGDVRLHPETGTPKECMTAYDGTVQQDWTDGTVKKCVQDTNFSPEEYAQAWEDA